MMTGKSKFKAPKLRTVGALRPTEQPEPKLTLHEMRLIQAYRKCDDEDREFLAGLADDFSEDKRFKRPEMNGPALKLVKGGPAS